MTIDVDDDGFCFACGPRNPTGLRLAFRRDAEAGTAASEIAFAPHFQGWAGIVHGGLLATVLDEIMVHAAGARGVRTVTGEMTVRYLRPAPTGARLTLLGRMLEDRGRVVTAEGEIRDENGQVLARASGKLVKISKTGASPA